MTLIPARQILNRFRSEAEPMLPPNMKTAIDLLTLAVSRSKKPEADLLKIINTAIGAVNDPATDPLPNPEKRPETPENRATAIRNAVMAVGGDNELAELYIRSNKSLAVIKSELLPLAAMSRRFGKIA